MKSTILCLVLVAVIRSSTSTAVVQNSGKKMVCYYGSWAVYRPGNGKFDVENIDPFLCTHIIYGFTGLSADNTMISLDPYNDLYDNWGKGAFMRFTGLKNRNPNLKALIAIGGWNEGSEKYSMMVSDPAKRRVFLNSVVSFIQRYNFDGLDFDWEYPGSRGGEPQDKQNYISMIQELRTAFAPYGWLLTSAVASGKAYIDPAYDIPALSSILDQIHLMSYDFHGAWEPYTGLNAPLYSNPQYDAGDNLLLNLNWAVNYWLSKGAPANKLIIGMPLYGRGFTLDNQFNNGFYAPATYPIAAGPYTRQEGTWGYNEICEKLYDGSWTIVRDACYQAPYARRGNQWIGYDDYESLTRKGQYVAAMGLGGALTWSIETDDFTGYCHGTPFILTKTIVEAINGPTNRMPYNPCGGEVNPASTTSTPVQVTQSTTTTRPPQVISSTMRATTTQAPVSSSSTTTTARPSSTTTSQAPVTLPTTTQAPVTLSTTTRAAITPSTTTQAPATPPTTTQAPPTPPTTTRPLTTPSTTTRSTTLGSGSTPSTTATTTASNNGGTTSGGVFTCPAAGNFANPNDCGSYYECVAFSQAFTAYYRPCAPGTAFSSITTNCIHPAQVPGCENFTG